RGLVGRRLRRRKRIIREGGRGLVWRKLQTEIEKPGDAGPVDDRAARCPAHESGEAIQTHPLRLEEPVPALTFTEHSVHTILLARRRRRDREPGEIDDDTTAVPERLQFGGAVDRG